MGKRQKSQWFPATQWSLVGRAGKSDEITRQKAISELLTVYQPGLQNFLVRTRGISPELAEDLLQGFIADKVLAFGLVRHADQGRGKFRNFILKSLNNYVNTRISCNKQSHVINDSDEKSILDRIPANDEVDLFDREWIQQVVHDAMCLMEQECRENNRMDMWEIFRLRVVDPMLHGADPADYQVLITQFGFATPRQAMNLLANAKRAFTRNLRLAVGKYVSTEEDIEIEIEDLRKIVQR